ncbi:hypothetical protein Angca_008551, partial [Angiostrongylus cantonensis]
MLRGTTQLAAPDVSQVSLVHASDSVRTMPSAMPNGQNAFYPSSRMTKPPIRVVAQPPPSRFPSQSQHYSASSSPHSLSSSPQCGFSSAKKSPLALPTVSVSPMANRREVDRRQAMRTQNTTDATQKINLIRRELADEEGELRRLSELERETRVLTKRNVEKEAELNKLSAELREQQSILRTAAGRVEALRWQIDELYRRRKAAAAAALSEQRKMQQQIVRVPESGRIVSVSERPRASVEPFQVSIPTAHGDTEPDMKEEKQHAQADVSSLDEENSSEQLPSPPQEPAEIASLSSTYVSPPGTDSVGSSSRGDTSPSPPKDPHPTSEQISTSAAQLPEKHLRPKEIACSQEFQMGNLFTDSLDESKLRSGKSDLVSIRNDSLKAAKRRSWAASEGVTLPEADTIRRILEEQRRGRNHFIPELPTPREEAKMEVNRRALKGILRPVGLKKERRHIEFDPLALLLDAALEGELDLVKSSAAKLSDVSAANDEGITALHNAICAGHYEIVKFLIEADADVNAQDSDGWTPLHCAASCNNLPMVRQLVEGGACVLASTLSDMETPVEKCEEDEEGYDGCLRYLTTAHNSTGTINNGMVYAAYDYDAQFEDELSFKAGDQLRVVSKDDKEKNWWTCERVGHNGEIGLVPRTYVALYPALRHRKR